MRIRRNASRRAAFTLIEMLVVVAIIVALAGIGGFALMGQLETARRDTAHGQVKTTLTNACKAFQIKNGRLPNDLTELFSRQAIGGPFLEDENALRDPWGGTYQMQAKEDSNGNLKPYIFATDPNTGVTIDNWSAYK